MHLMKPQPGEIIQNPAACTGGFLIAAERAIRAVTDDYFALPEKRQEFRLRRMLYGTENVQSSYRLLLMKLFLHGINACISASAKRCRRTAPRCRWPI